MTSFSFNDIGKSLKEASQKVQGKGVSFAGKSLKLNTEDDAKQVADAIKACDEMEYLDLEGNTLGPEAAKGISVAIEANGAHLKRALWKDMFTGRMKDEIPVALQHFGRGLCAAGTQLVELDLSDNAFGPIGVRGLADLLRSSCCYTLQELRLNNNGLGITGGKLLAQALLDCHTKSLEDGAKPLSLRVFIAGRNRLENEGAQALAGVFEKLTSLEEVVMPQNGIYHPGVSALAQALSVNQGLRILNLNDNTVGPKGAKALAKVLRNFTLLERINLGDCLLKSEGAIHLAEALLGNDYSSLQEINLGFNEIRASAVTTLARAAADKANLNSLFLDGNEFGSAGKEELTSLLKDYDKLEALGPLDEDESNDEEEEEEDKDDEEDESEEDEDEDEDDEEEEDDEEKEEDEGSNGHSEINNKKAIKLRDFLKEPNGDSLLHLTENRLEDMVNFATNKAKQHDTQVIEELMKVAMKVSSNCDSGYMEVRKLAEKLTDGLYEEMFRLATSNEQIPTLNNALLVYLGLIKGEDKKRTKIDWNIEGCYKALEKVCQQSYFLPQTRNTLKFFVERPIKTSKHTVDPNQESKDSLIMVLQQIQS